MNTPWPSSQSSPWNLAALLSEAGISSLGDDMKSVNIMSLCDDSRRAERGSLFFAMKGGESDGHDYVVDAVSAGASAIVVERKTVLAASVPQIIVTDVRSALAKMSATFFGFRGRTHGDPQSTSGSECLPASKAPTNQSIRDGAKPAPAQSSSQKVAPRLISPPCGHSDQRRKLTLIGITGTNGKSTVAWLVRAILRHAKYRCAMLGTIEYDLVGRRMAAPLTTPGPIDLCRHLAEARSAGASHAVLEVSSHALRQRRTAGLSIDVAVFTNLSGDHLDYHGSMEAYWQAKRTLFDALDENAVALVNDDDPVADLMVANTRARVVRYGLHCQELDVAVQVEAATVSGSRFRLTVGLQSCKVQTPLLGRYNLANVAAAAGVADVMGVPIEVTKQALQACSGVPGRLERVSDIGAPFAVFVDYAHTDDALRNVLGTLKSLTAGRLVCVFGCGGDRDKTKRPRMAKVSASLADAVIVTSDNPRTESPEAIIGDILTGFDAASRKRVSVEPDRRVAIERAIRSAAPGDAILIAGKGHEKYQLIGHEVIDFDDCKVARRYLEQPAMEQATP